MAKLAIKGHETRGKEVIEILEMLGGKNDYQVTAIRENRVYFVDENKNINFLKINQIRPEQFTIFILEEFLEKYPFKVGDKVSVCEYETKVRIDEMKWDGFEIQYSVSADETEYLYEWYSAEELNEYNEPCKEETMEEKSTNHVYSVDDVDVISFDIAQKDIYQLDLKDNFLVILREGKYYVERIKPKYPKTYEECYNVLGYEPDEDEISCYNGYLIESFVKLLICRDAYWKIAGEKMGLDNPWEPDSIEMNHAIVCRDDGSFLLHRRTRGILTFPTEEMRDIFYKNFKYLIEECKELL